MAIVLPPIYRATRLRCSLLNLGLPAIPWTRANAMTVAMNAAPDFSYTGRRLVNLVQSMLPWTPVTISGGARTTTYVPHPNYTGAAGTWSQWQGTLYGDGDGTGTDAKYFWAKIVTDDRGLPSTANGGDGLYIVLNPSGQEIAVGTSSNQTLGGGFRSDKYFTFTFAGGGAPGGGFGLWSRRSCANTGAGNVQIIPHAWIGNGTIDTVNGVISSPGTTGYTSGNPWNPDYISWHKNLGTQHLRWMDSNSVNPDVAQDWADRVPPTAMSFYSPYCGGPGVFGFAFPYELIVDFSNRTGIDPWINLPARVTTDYITQCANVFKGLNSNRRIAPCYLNESWNFFGAFGVGTTYVAYMQFTRHVATPSDVSVPGAPVFLSPSHGRSVGDTLVLFSTRENTLAGMPYWMQGAAQYTISAVPDADHFTLNLSAAGRSVPAGLVNIEWAWTNEPGVSSTGTQANINHGLQQAAVWGIFEAALGYSRVVHIMESQAADATHTSGRVGASATTIANTELVAIAPYYAPMYWIAEFNGGGGSITPRVWSSLAGTAWWAVYASGATPTPLDVVNQTGTGFIGGGGTAGTAVAAASTVSPTPALPAVLGLTDGVNYASFIVNKETATGNFWMIGTGTDPLNPANVVSTNGAQSTVYDTYANQGARSRMAGIAAANYDAHMNAISSVGGTAKVVMYEGGPDFNLWSAATYSLVKSTLPTWLIGFLADNSAGSGVPSLKHNYNHLARVGVKTYTHYLEEAGGSVYDFATSSLFSNQSGARYTMLSAYSGVVPQQAALPSILSTNQIATAITSAPGYPHTVMALTPGYTYSIADGDWTSNFSISGTNLVMNNGNEVNFSQYAPRTLTVEAADSYSSVFSQITVPLGTAWWPADAQFVWDSVGASAGTSMSPPNVPPFSNFGSALAEITGTGNPPITSSSGTVTNDLWQMSTYVFANANAMTQTIPTNVPFMVAHIVDIGDQTTTFQYGIGVSAGSNSISWGVGSNNTNSRWRVLVNGVAVVSGLLDGASNPSKGTKVVHWIYVDPPNGTAIGGQNQTDYTTGAQSGLSFAALNFTKDVRIGNANGGSSSASQMYHGSVVVLSRTGMTKADAKAIVQAMQTHHGI